MDRLIWITNRAQGKTSSVQPDEADETPRKEETTSEQEQQDEDTTDDEMPELEPS